MAAFDDDARRWARTVLGMSAGDDPRFALLRKVKAAGFNVPADVGAAFRVVSQAHGKIGAIGPILESAGFGYERDQQHRQAVDAFAELFFTLPVAERGMRFRALRAECGGDPLLEGRLARLGRGLEIDLDRDGLTPAEERVVSIVRELLPLAADERAIRRRELLREVSRDQPFDFQMLDRLRRSWPDLDRLDPELWRTLESAVALRQPRRAQPVIERAPTAAPARPPTRPAPPPPKQPSQSGSFAWWPMVLFGILSLTLRTCNSQPAREQPVFHPAFRLEEDERKNAAKEFEQMQREKINDMNEKEKAADGKEREEAVEGKKKVLKDLDDALKNLRVRKNIDDDNR